MPLYEYECEACGHRFEVIQRFSDPPVEKCPSCGGAVRKLLSSPAIQFKGSGWYITDYARKASGDSKEKRAEPPAGDKSASSPDSSASSPAASPASGASKDS